MMRSLFFTALLALPTTHAFVVASIAPRPLIKTTTTAKPQIAVQQLRGGTVQASILVPPTVLGATAIATAAGTLAYIRQAYIFSLSYGLSMLGIGASVLLSSPSGLLKAHAYLVAAYGLRLFAFLFWRQKLQPGYDGEARLRSLDKTPRLKRTPVILSTAFFYGLMSSPLLFHVSAAPLTGMAATISKAGGLIAGVGLIYEAVADQQKSLYKMALRKDGKPDALYTSGVYAQSRHANYFGELVFWTGSFLMGVPAVFAAGPLYKLALRAVASGLGLAGIYFIMLSATKRLEGRQAESYGGTSAYEEYVKTSGKLLPKLV